MVDEIKSLELVQIVVFKLQDEEFGVDISQIREVIRPTEITRIPKSPEFICGIINLRGIITLIIDLRKRLGISQKEIGENTRILVAEMNDMTIGMIVDEVIEIISLQTSDIEPISSYGDEFKYLKGIGKLGERLIVLIDLNMIITEEEVGNIEEVHEALIEAMGER